MSGRFGRPDQEERDKERKRKVAEKAAGGRQRRKNKGEEIEKTAKKARFFRKKLPIPLKITCQACGDMLK